jgi:PAS domain S-box-containing protein
MASAFPMQYKRRDPPTIQAVKSASLGQRMGGGYLLQLLVVFVAYLVAGKLGQATTSIRSSNLGPVWPAYGIALAAILTCGYRVWLAVAAGAFVVAFFSPVPHIAALGQAAGATLAAMTGALLLQRMANFRPSLSRLSDVLSLIVLGGFGSSIVSASIGVSVLYATHVHAYSGLSRAWLIYWLGDATGVLLVTPIVLRFTDFLKLRDRVRIAELTTLLLLVTTTCLVIFSNLPAIPVKLDVMAFAVLPFIMWAAIRFGVGVTAFSILIVATIATIQTALGSGPFTSNTTFLNAVLLDVFFGILSVSGLSLAAVIAEREHAERERERVISQQAAMEARLKADEALRESEERFRLAAQAGKMFAYEWDVATDVIVRSKDFARILGNDENVETTGQQVLCRIHKDDRERVKAAVAALSPENPNLQITYRMLRPDGTIIWVERNSRAEFDNQGTMRRIVGMVKDVTDRSKAEEALRISEERLRLAQQAARIGTFEWNIQTGVNTWTPELEAMHGLSPGGFGGTQTDWENLVHPDDLQQIHQLVDEAFKTGRPMTGEWRVIWPDGTVHWIAGRWQVLMNELGEPSRMVGVNVDITDRKQAEEALARMSRKLLIAQEQERARIARELHDDINQRIAMLAVRLEQLHDDPSEIQSRVQELRRVTIEISDDVQALSHELHSSKLEYLGVVAGIRSWCREFGERQKINVNFTSDMSNPALPFDISVCLLRVVQEAVHNAIKHSEASQIEVQLRIESDEVHLTVSDLGKGFDVDAARQGSGLGLTSMQERVRLVNGSIVIQSMPMKGTNIYVRVPFKSEQGTQRAAG